MTTRTTPGAIAAKLEIRPNGDIYRGDVLIISKHYGYDTRDAETVKAMVEAYNKEAKS